MAVTTNKALLFVGGGIAAAAIVAYAVGAFNPRIKDAPETIVALPESDQADSKNARLPDTEAPAAALQAPAEQSAAPELPAPTIPEAAAPETGSEPAVIPPSFDVVRVEGSGSIVVAGKAVPNAKVDLLVGSNVIGSAIADAGGDFAVVLDDPLKPGDYQIVLRATAPDNVVAMSIETAVVSVPETPEGQVLALVEEPGKPSHMITLPAPQPPSAAAAPPAVETAPPTPAPADPTATTSPAAEVPPTAEPKPEGEMQAALPQQTEPAQPPAPPAGPTVRVEAVEIDGRKIFVAGVADPGRTVRGYANQILLGDAKASPDGRYLIEADRDLPVGDYIIRVDALQPDGVKVAARAAVPFEREPGETIAAVAPPAPEPVTPSVPATPPAAAAQPPSAEAPAAATSPVQVTSESKDAAGLPAAEMPAQPPAVTEPPAAEPKATAETLSGQTPSVDMPVTQAPAAADAAGSQLPAAAPAEQPAGETPAAEAPQITAEAPATETPAAETPAIGAPASDAPAAATPSAEAPQQPAASTEQPATQPQTPQTPAATEQPVVEAPAVAEQPSAPAVTTAPAEQPAPAAEPASPPAVAEAPAPAEAPPAAITPPAAEPPADVAAAPQDPALPAPPSADGVSEVLAPKLQSVDSAVIIRRGDTLWRISRRVYGRGVRYSTIYLANQTQIEDPDRIWPGQVFKVPEKSNDGKAEADYSRLGNRLTTVPAEGAE